MSQTVWLQRPNSDVPWGFRLGGGAENREPIKVQRVTVGSVASKSLMNGDVITRIGNTDVVGMLLTQCNELIKDGGNLLQLMVAKSNGPMTSPGQSPQGYSTKLNEQLSSMDVRDYSRQPSSSSQPYFSPTSPPGAPGYHPLANVPPPPPPAPAPVSPYSGGSSPALSPGRAGRGARKIPPTVPDKPKQQIPDAVLNMAARGDPDKKPFTYAADMDEIKEHRDRVRRKPHGIPSYQNALNLPQFDDRPKPRYTKPKSLLPDSIPQQASPPVAPGPGEGTFIHAQYNSPMQMYSDNAMEEAFKGQTGGVVVAAAKAGANPTSPMNDITQSETYKMIHGIDKQKTRPYGSPTRAAPTQPRAPVPEDDRKWTGLNRVDDIPSKAFHRLQSMTDNPEEHEIDNVPEIDTSSIRHKDNDNEVGGYAEASIRYMGRNIPSKSFRMLQSMTGSDDTLPSTPAAHRQRQARRREEQRHQEEEQQPPSDEIVDISYVGGNIPSRSFKMLQNMTGGPDESNVTKPGSLHIQTSEAPSDDLGSPGGPPTKQVHSLDRRQRRREKNQQIRKTQDPATPEGKKFDEQAYLSGQLEIVSGSVNNPPPRRNPRQVIVQSSGQEEEEPVGIKDFDERAYLAGKISVFGGETKPVEKEEKKFREKAPWEREQDFDPRRAEIFEDDKFINKGNKDDFAPDAPWVERQAEIDESSFSAPGPSNTEPSTAGEPYKGPELKKPQDFREKAPWERRNKPGIEPEDESAYQEGKIPVLAERRHSKGQGQHE